MWLIFRDVPSGSSPVMSISPPPHCKAGAIPSPATPQNPICMSANQGCAKQSIGSPGQRESPIRRDHDQQQRGCVFPGVIFLRVAERKILTRRCRELVQRRHQHRHPWAPHGRRHGVYQYHVGQPGPHDWTQFFLPSSFTNLSSVVFTAQGNGETPEFVIDDIRNVAPPVHSRAGIPRLASAPLAGIGLLGRKNLTRVSVSPRPPGPCARHPEWAPVCVPRGRWTTPVLPRATSRPEETLSCRTPGRSRSG